MGCLKLHITEHKLLPDATPSSPWKQNFKDSKNNLSLCRSFYKTCTGSYRFGFNGMEMDNEVKGTGNHYTTQFRQYDPRLGRWFSIDPKAHIQQWQSPYSAFENNPIYFTDPRGDLSKEKRLYKKIKRKTKKYKKRLKELYNIDNANVWKSGAESLENGKKFKITYGFEYTDNQGNVNSGFISALDDIYDVPKKRKWGAKFAFVIMGGGDSENNQEFEFKDGTVFRIIDSETLDMLGLVLGKMAGTSPSEGADFMKNNSFSPDSHAIKKWRYLDTFYNGKTIYAKSRKSGGVSNVRNKTFTSQDTQRFSKNFKNK